MRCRRGCESRGCDSGKPPAQSPPTPLRRHGERGRALTVTLLRESFSAVNARFHLVGIYTLVALLVRFAEHWTGDDPSGLPLMLGAMLLYVAADGGVFGVLFQAAMGPKEPLSFLQWTAGLFL